MGSWFPRGKNEEQGWRLDIVSLLAVIGESSMEEHSQAMTSSWTCVLPRIIPAPQALLKATRPSRLPQVNAAVVGVHNGTLVNTLNYFPNIIHPIEDLPPFAFKVMRITHRKEYLDKLSKLQPKPEHKSLSYSNSTDLRNLENGPTPLRRRATIGDRVRAMSTMSPDKPKPRVPSRKLSPLNILAVLSFLLTFGLLGWAIAVEDGVACIALATISIASSVIGYASWWSPVLMNRTSTIGVRVPDGDVVIRTREGAFLIVKCNEDVARELYTGTEECKYYVPNRPYRALVGIGTFLLMVSVVLLGNCNFTMQAAIGVSYIVLNGAFWIAALLKKNKFWNLSIYHWEDITPKDAVEAHKVQDHGDPEAKPSYTRTMWYAIRETKKIDWVKRGGAAPSTHQWDDWLQEAARNVDNKHWPAVKRKDEIVGKTDTLPQATAKDDDTAKQHVPAVEIPLQPTK
ncbi:hypothetical protein F5884DRAFT_297390 [Xylogone sp. PMI_703]|nr:hypothetical protein F5884DRAFT_297390 [Xylogone sp. PMI_703]